MDRRELFKTIAGVAATAGVTAKVQVAEASERTVPALAIMECEGYISQEQAERIKATLEHGLKGTPFEGLKCIVLDKSLTLSLLDAQGRVLNRDLGEG